MTLDQSVSGQAEAGRLKRLATYAAVGVAGTLIAIKLWAWAVTGSIAMLASLVAIRKAMVESGCWHV